MSFDDSLLGSARVRIRPDMDGFQREADRTVGAAMKSAAKVAAVTAGAAVAVGAGMVLRDSLKSASDLEQAVGALSSVFGPATAAMQANAKAAKDVGLSQADYSQSAAVLGAQLKNLGIAQDQLAPTTDGLMKSAADMAAQFGGTTVDAVAAVSSLMRGERDPIEAYGISMSEASIQAEMAATGFDKTQATLSLLNKQLESSGTVGAAAREFDSAAGSSQRMAAQMENARAAIGTALLPIMAELSSAAGDFAERNGPAVAAAVQSFAGFVRDDLMPELKDLGTWLADNVLPILKDVGGAIADNTDKLVPLAAAVAAVYAAWKVYQGVVAVVNIAVTVASIAAQTAAWVANTAAMVANKAVWLASQALYGAQVFVAFVATIAAQTAAWIANTAAVVANKVAMVAGQAVMVAMRAAVIAWTAVQWALNAALSANPIGLVVMAIAGLIAAVVLLYNKNEGFRQLVQTVWAAIKNAIGGVVDWLSTWVPAAFEAVKNAIGTAMEFIRNVIEVVWKAISWYVTTYINIVRTVVETVFNVIRTVIETVMNVIRTVISVVWSAIVAVVTTYINAYLAVVRFVFDAIRAAIEFVMNTIRSVIANVWSGIQFLWNTAVNAVLGTTRTVMDAVSGKFNEALEKVKSLFSGAVTAIGAIWDKVTGVVKRPIADMFDWINRNMIDPINTVLGKFSDSVKLGKLPPVFHTGGYTGDKIKGREGMALLRNDEFVSDPFATARNRAALEAGNNGARLAVVGEAINAGRMGFGIGGPFPGIGNMLDDLTSLVAKGAEFAVNAVGDPLLGALRSQFGGRWSPDVVIGGMQNVLDSVGSWAGSRDKAAAAQAALATAAGGFMGPGTGIISRPLMSYAVTSEYGPRWGSFHAGIDLGAPGGTPIYAAAAGKIMQAGWNDGYGNYILMDHGGGLGTSYGHMSSIVAQAGQIVAAQALIGRVGTTGDSTGDHLHFEVLQNGNRVNPRGFAQFDSGGWLKPGWSATYNGTGKPEAVLTDKQWKQISGGQVGGQGAVINITNIYPQAEPTSVTTSRALHQAAMVGAL
jgi:murein DD-endopeptidase MepM/ murein hydrolase activator NlpD